MRIMYIKLTRDVAGLLIHSVACTSISTFQYCASIVTIVTHQLLLSTLVHVMYRVSQGFLILPLQDPSFVQRISLADTG
jgi:hypothetical protein